jgi:hypothetical protein
VAAAKMHPDACHCHKCVREFKAEQAKLHKQRSERAKAANAARKLQK